jgi:hypothetical protein
VVAPTGPGQSRRHPQTLRRTKQPKDCHRRTAREFRSATLPARYPPLFRSGRKPPRAFGLAAPRLSATRTTHQSRPRVRQQGGRSPNPHLQARLLLQGGPWLPRGDRHSTHALGLGRSIRGRPTGPRGPRREPTRQVVTSRGQEQGPLFHRLQASSSSSVAGPWPRLFGSCAALSLEFETLFP